MTQKNSDGIDPNAVQRGLNWLVDNAIGNEAFIYFPQKNNAVGTAGADLQNGDLLKELLKNNSLTVKNKNGIDVTIKACYGSGSAKSSGNFPAPGCSAPVLALYANPTGFSWLINRVHSSAAFCLVPWTQEEANAWHSANPTIVI